MNRIWIDKPIEIDPVVVSRQRKWGLVKNIYVRRACIKALMKLDEAKRVLESWHADLPQLDKCLILCTYVCIVGQIKIKCTKMLIISLTRDKSELY